jgi:hypothetical protein
VLFRSIDHDQLRHDPVMAVLGGKLEAKRSDAGWKLIGYFCLGFPEADDAAPVLQRLAWEERRPAKPFLFRR